MRIGRARSPDQSGSTQGISKAGSESNVSKPASKKFLGRVIRFLKSPGGDKSPKISKNHGGSDMSKSTGDVTKSGRSLLKGAKIFGRGKSKALKDPVYAEVNKSRTPPASPSLKEASIRKSNSTPNLADETPPPLPSYTDDRLRPPDAEVEHYENLDSIKENYNRQSSSSDESDYENLDSIRENYNKQTFSSDDPHYENLDFLRAQIAEQKLMAGDSDQVYASVESNPDSPKVAKASQREETQYAEVAHGEKARVSDYNDDDIFSDVEQMNVDKYRSRKKSDE